MKHPDSLDISEIFFSLQGESTLAGTPCVFVRLAGCDLRCSWCDTGYAFSGGTRMTLAEILRGVEQYRVRLVEITGGEPLMQENSLKLMERLLDAGYRVMLETGGHRSISPVDRRVKIIYDIKCPGSGMSGKNLWENLFLLKPEDEIKFVLSDREDYDWAADIVRQYSLATSHTVLFSPVAEALSPRELAEWILGDRLPVRLQVQLHRVVWGGERGR